MVESIREIGDKAEPEIRFDVTAMALIASLIGFHVRDHWAFENNPRWIRDLVFRDEKCRARTPTASSARSPLWTTNSSPRSLPHSQFTRFPPPRNEKGRSKGAALAEVRK